MDTTIVTEISSARAKSITRCLERMFDAREKAVNKAWTEADVRRVARLDGEYNAARETLAMCGIRVKVDRHTKRPIGIESFSARATE